MFDLYCDSEIVYETLQALNGIKPGVCASGLRVPGYFDAFETAVCAILGQQITVKAASVLVGRIASACGTPVETGIEGLTHTFPHPESIVSLENAVEETLGELGVIAARSKCIFALAKALENGEIELDGCMNPETEMKKLMKIKGIGSWTANYIDMRAMERPDAFLETDIGIKHALPGLYTERTSSNIRKMETMEKLCDYEFIEFVIIRTEKPYDLYLSLLLAFGWYHTFK